jgi:RNA polymerase sigma factor (sigma-70 family)
MVEILVGAAHERSEATVDWSGLYTKLYPGLYRALAGATGSAAGVEDAIQDAFAQAIAGKLPRGVRSPESWLFVVALNRVRRTRRRARIFERLGRGAPSAGQLDATLTRLAVMDDLSQLRPRDRELLVAKFYVGMTQDEIAKAMGLPRGTVAAAISRAAARFRGIRGKLYD